MINKSYQIVVILFLGLTSLVAQQTTTSALSDGTIYKLAIQESGIYKLSYDQIKDNTDIPVDQINPNNIQLYGNRGGFLPRLNNIERADDLTENAIFVSGADDGSFDQGDYILFYAEGADRVNLSSGALIYEKNVFDLSNYYFLKIGEENGNRITTENAITTSDYKDYSSRLLRHEVDQQNLLGQFGSTQGSGKQWYGEIFTNTRSQDFSSSFRVNPSETNNNGTLKLSFAARSDESSMAKISFNGQTFEERISGVTLSNLESFFARKAEITQQVEVTQNPSIVVEFEGANDGATEGWLDYIQLITTEKIAVGNTPFELYSTADVSQAEGGYKFTHAGNGLNIWKINKLNQVKTVAYATAGNEVSFGYETNGIINHFIAFDNNTAFKTPVFAGQVVNQNLHALERVDLLIITNKLFREQAELLASHRQSNDNLIVEVVDIDEVYNEFAGGKSDPVAIRDFVRLLHLRDSNFKYLILFGDATYDYRGLTPNLPNHNFVPTYETEESLHMVEAFPTDDYFGLLSENEGAESLAGDLEIGIGRIPAGTVDEAEAVVNKIIHYDTSPNRFGDWRTKIGFAADDVDATWDTTHLRDSDEIAKNTKENHPNLLQQKVYFDAFKQEATPGGSRYPDANSTINDNIFKGQLVFNYLGHGGPKGLSQERVVQVPDIRSWSNMDKLTVFITATCSFTGFDEPNLVSAGEHLILNPRGGAVALFTTVRSVYASSNKILTAELYKELFNRTNGEPARLGDVISKSKNNGPSGTNPRKFLLMGDPSMKLALPRYDIEITHFNDIVLEENQLDTVGALGRAKLSGRIVQPNGDETVSDFNGEISIAIYDKVSDLQTLVNDGKGSPLSFEVDKNILYKGTASVTNGVFDISFLLPNDINFSFGQGNIYMYATDNQSKDASGSYANLVIGGSSDNVIEDNEGPEISIFFDDRSFEYGGETGVEPILLLDLADENGINLSSTSIGHDITATLEDPNGDKIVLNEFYEPTINKIGEGSVIYQMDALEEGPHKIYIKAWDILNNSSEEVMEFVVTNTGNGEMRNVLNYPNPFSTRTEFTFEHDLSNTQVDLVINIFTVSGKLIKSIQDSRFASGSRISDISWDGRDDFGNKLAKGVYLYKINMNAPELNLSRESDFSKLVILN